MRKTVALLLSGIALAGTLTGCYSTPDGRMKAGVPFGKDTFESRYQRPVPQIFSASRQVLELNGTLISENTISHTLEAKIDNRTVVVKVDEVEQGVSRVMVLARKKAGVADPDLASEIDKQIALKLASTPGQR
jgi:hypothetical protein